MKKVIVVGGGISGLCSAYYLVKDGHKVTILDQTNMDSGTSYINAGYITPSHFVPLAAPGIITQGLKWMLNSSSPFYMKPRWDMDFFKWALLFKKSAAVSNLERALPVLKELNLKSRALYEELLASHEFDFHYERKGVLMAYCSEKSEKEEHEVAEKAIKEGLEVSILSQEDLRKVQPALSDQVRGAVHYKCDAHMTPNHFMEELKTWLQEHGVDFKLGQKVENVTIKGKQIVSLRTRDSNYEADEFVLASGSWTSKLAKTMGLKIPIQGGKGYSMDVRRPTGITLPTILVDARMAITPMDGFTRFAGTMEFSGNNETIKKERVAALANAVKAHYKDFTILPEEQDCATSGLRPVSPDGLPFIGKTAKYNNLTIASGHAMMGWSLGPITGKLVSQEVNGSRPLMDVAPLSPERFR